MVNSALYYPNQIDYASKQISVLAWIEQSITINIRNFLHRQLIQKYLCKKLMSITITIYGVTRISKDMSNEELVSFKNRFQKTIDNIEHIDDMYRDIKYMNDKNLKLEFKKLLNSAYALDATLHAQIHKGNVVTNTPDYITQQLSEYSKEAISSSLIK